MCGQTTLDECLSYHRILDRKPRERGGLLDPAQGDNRFPRMTMGDRTSKARIRKTLKRAGYEVVRPEESFLVEKGGVYEITYGGKPSKGTKKDKRLGKNKKKGK